jgi:hypothetical protein
MDEIELSREHHLGSSREVIRVEAVRDADEGFPPPP